MKVICKGNKYCEDRKTCKHSKLHEINSACYYYPTSGGGDDCDCDVIYTDKFIRKEKLNKINELRE